MWTVIMGGGGGVVEGGGWGGGGVKRLHGAWVAVGGGRTGGDGGYCPAVGPMLTGTARIRESKC